MSRESSHKSDWHVCLLSVHRSCETDEPGLWKPARLGLRLQGWCLLPSWHPAAEPQSDASGLDSD